MLLTRMVMRVVKMIRITQEQTTMNLILVLSFLMIAMRIAYLL
jgi:hypothetical protein